MAHTPLKKLIYGIPLLTILGMLLSFFPVQPVTASMAAILYVSTLGNDANTCIAVSQPCRTIDGAIAKASPGSSIFVASGIYTSENESVVTIDRDIHLLGGWEDTFTIQTGYSTIKKSESNTALTLRGISVNEGVHATVERFVVQNSQIEFSPSLNPHTGVFNAGFLTLEKSTISGNKNDNYFGGGIYNTGVMTVTQSIITRNYAYISGGGIYNTFGSLILLNSTVSENVAGSSGGGILNQANLNLIDSLVKNNQVEYDQYNNRWGGGIHNEGFLFLERSGVVDNKAYGNGGGILSGGYLNIHNSYIRNNSSTLSGGGIFVYAQAPVIVNSTIDGNTSGDMGGGIYSDISSGFILSSNTISHNKASNGGGIYNQSVIEMQNTIVAENSAESGPDCAGGFSSLGYNLVANSAGCGLMPGVGDQINVNPQMIYLADVVGYNPLLANSPAINAANPSGCTDDQGLPLANDQRGAPRSDRCDIGAYEYTSPGELSRLIPAAGTPQSSPVHSPFTTSFKVLAVDSLGTPVNSPRLTFTAPETGPSGVFIDTGTFTTTTSTDPQGIATAPTFRANQHAGSFTVNASAGEGVTSAIFHLNNIGKIFLPGTYCKFCENFFDDFNNPSSGWWVGDDGTVKAEYEGGEYRVKTNSSDYMFMFRAPTCLRPDYIVETDVRWEQPGFSYGLIFGMQGDFERGYVLEVSSDYQAFWLYRFDADHYEMILNTFQTQRIEPGNLRNHLKIERRGLYITISINGTEIGTWDDGYIVGETSVGLVVTQYNDKSESIVRFDNFRFTFESQSLQSKSSGILSLESPHAADMNTEWDLFRPRLTH